MLTRPAVLVAVRDDGASLAPVEIGMRVSDPGGAEGENKGS
jgi:hypothetical protein